MTRGIRQESSVEEHRDMPSDEPRGDSPSFVDMSDHMAIGFAAASQDVRYVFDYFSPTCFVISRSSQALLF